MCPSVLNRWPDTYHLKEKDPNPCSQTSSFSTKILSALHSLQFNSLVLDTEALCHKSIQKVKFYKWYMHTYMHAYIHTYIRTYISNKLKFFKLRPLEETSFEDEKRSHFSLFWGDRFSVRAERKRKGKKTKREINMWSYTYIYWTKEIISSVILECREIGISLVLAKWICSSIQLWNRFLNVALCRNFYLLLNELCPKPGYLGWW